MDLIGIVKYSRLVKYYDGGDRVHIFSLWKNLLLRMRSASVAVPRITMDMNIESAPFMCYDANFEPRLLIGHSL